MSSRTLESVKAGEELPPLDVPITAAIVVTWITSGAGGLTDGLAGLGVGLLLMLPGFALGFTGAGDVKLLSAVSLWAGFEQNAFEPLMFDYFLFDYLVLVALCGGGLSIALLLLRRLVFGFLLLQSSPERVTLPRYLLPREQLPYGVAIALPSIYLAYKLPILGGFLFL